MQDPVKHKAGFVSIIGRPNVGKSTLMNRLVGERISIITSKAQTTRHRIQGIISGDDFQIVYSDTPGIIKPVYELQGAMMKFVNSSFEDADVILVLVEPGEPSKPEIINRVRKSKTRIFLLLNKIDLIDEEKLNESLEYWKNEGFEEILPVSAKEGTNIDELFKLILEHIPEHPPYFPKDTLTDKPERFIASEIVREKIFLHYKQEIPYSSEVVITEFKEDEKIIRMRAEIYVERKSQKGIIIGKGGLALKQVGIDARKELEKFFDKQVHLETYVRVEEKWRSRKGSLRKFGYE